MITRLKAAHSARGGKRPNEEKEERGRGREAKEKRVNEFGNEEVRTEGR